MAQRRMFSLQVVDTDAFLEMPLSAQALYFHLGMRADDDGFVSNTKRIQKMVGAAEDDLKLLLAKRFLLPFDSGIVVLKHWKICNYIQKDRYRPTLYKDEKSQLWLKSDGAYTDHPAPGAKPCIAPAEPEKPELPPPSEPGDNLDTSCIHRIGKDRLGEDRLGKVRLGKVNNNISVDDDAAAVRNYVQSRGLDAQSFLGTSEELFQQIAEISADAFAMFGGRRPTPTDTMQVYSVIADSNGENAQINPDRLELLLYAMEQAACAGCPGNWNYVSGVLANLHNRGITTLADAEAYDERR